MAFSRYDPKTKASIIKAATEARAANKPWKDAFSAAKAAGYKGSVDALDVMIRNAKNAGKAKQKSAPAKVKTAATTTTPAKAMPAATAKPAALSRYDPKVKSAFIKAALDARAIGKNWTEAHAAAKKAGYKGKLKGLDRMIRKSKTKTSAVKPRARSIAKAVKPKIKATKPAAAARGYDPVHKMIDAIVKEKVKAVVEKAIAELRKAVE